MSFEWVLYLMSLATHSFPRQGNIYTGISKNLHIYAYFAIINLLIDQISSNLI